MQTTLGTGRTPLTKQSICLWMEIKFQALPILILYFNNRHFCINDCAEVGPNFSTKTDIHFTHEWYRNEDSCEYSSAYLGSSIRLFLYTLYDIAFTLVDYFCGVEEYTFCSWRSILNFCQIDEVFNKGVEVPYFHATDRCNAREKRWEKY